MAESIVIPPDAEAWARCRTAWQGHDWDDAPSYDHGLHVPRSWVAVQFRCARCGMCKTYLFHPSSGETSRPYYSHKPRNYAQRGVTRADWKVLFVRQYRKANGS